MTKIHQIKIKINRKNIVIYTILCLSFIMIIIKFLPYSITNKITTNNHSKEDLILDAVLQNNICVTEYLLKHKVDINKQYKYGHTLLHNAALYGDIKMVKLLVTHGAIILKNDFGLSAINSARDNNYTKIEHYLVNYFDSKL